MIKCTNSFEIAFNCTPETQLALQKELAEIYSLYDDIKKYLDEGATRHGVICDNEDLYFEIGDEGYLFVEEKGCSYTAWSENPDHEGMGGSGSLNYVEPYVASTMEEDSLNDFLKKIEKEHPDFEVEWMSASFYDEETKYQKPIERD